MGDAEPMNGKLKNGIRASGLWGGWAVAVTACALAWNMWTARETRAQSEGSFMVRVQEHMRTTEPLLTEHRQMYTDIEVLKRAVIQFQESQARIESDLRDIRDVLYGRRPREPERR